MTLQPLHSKLAYIWGKFDFLFYQWWMLIIFTIFGCLFVKNKMKFLPYLRRPLVIYDFATAQFWISLYMRKIWFSFLSVIHTKYCFEFYDLNKNSHLMTPIPLSILLVIWIFEEKKHESGHLQLKPGSKVKWMKSGWKVARGQNVSWHKQAVRYWIYIFDSVWQSVTLCGTRACSSVQNPCIQYSYHKQVQRCMFVFKWFLDEWPMVTHT